MKIICPCSFCLCHKPKIHIISNDYLNVHIHGDCKRQLKLCVWQSNRFKTNIKMWISLWNFTSIWFSINNDLNYDELLFIFIKPIIGNWISLTVTSKAIIVNWFIVYSLFWQQNIFATMTTTQTILSLDEYTYVLILFDMYQIYGWCNVIVNLFYSLKIDSNLGFK